MSPWAALQALAHHTGRSLVSVSLAAITTNQELFDLMNSCSYPVSGSHRPNTLGFGSVIFILVSPSFTCLNSATARGPHLPCNCMRAWQPAEGVGHRLPRYKPLSNGKGYMWGVDLASDKATPCWNSLTAYWRGVQTDRSIARCP